MVLRAPEIFLNTAFDVDWAPEDFHRDVVLLLTSLPVDTLHFNIFQIDVELSAHGLSEDDNQVCFFRRDDESELFDLLFVFCDSLFLLERGPVLGLVVSITSS